MAYPERLLAEGERIDFELRPHWRSLILPTLWLLIIVGVSTYLTARVSEWIGDAAATNFLRAAIIIVAVFLAIMLFWRPFLVWLTTQYVFTNRRIIVRTGLIARHGRDMPWNKVNDVLFEHSVIERLFHSGRLFILSAAENGTLEIVDVPDVEHVQSEVYRLQDEDEAFRAARAEMYGHQFRTGEIPEPLEDYEADHEAAAEAGATPQSTPRENASPVTPSATSRGDDPNETPTTYEGPRQS